MSPIRHKYKYFHLTVQTAKDRLQKFHFCRLLFDVRQRTSAPRGMVSSSTLIGPFEFEHEREWPLNFRARSNSNGPVRVEDETTSRAAVVAEDVYKTWTRVHGPPHDHP